MYKIMHVYLEIIYNKSYLFVWLKVQQELFLFICRQNKLVAVTVKQNNRNNIIKMDKERKKCLKISVKEYFRVAKYSYNI